MIDLAFIVFVGLPIAVALIAWQVANGTALSPMWNPCLKLDERPITFWTYLVVQMAFVIVMVIGIVATASRLWREIQS